MIQEKKPTDCCGCTACQSICMHHAITMEPDNLGFLYPKVDTEKCVDCGLCERVCQFHFSYERYDNFDVPEVYGVRLKDLAEIGRSQSGGAFFALSEYFLKLGGVVYGAGYVEGFRVVHKRATTQEERNEMRGSKYVQSDLRGIFPLVKDDLRNGRKVLFSGTPCQIAGLRSYIGLRQSENLYTVDLVCHAVPSPAIWQAYVKWVEIQEGETIESVNFRNKRFGWHSHFETFKTSSKEIVRNSFRFFFFFKHLSVRYSCSHCPYTNLKRVGDITIGDFWGWEKYHKEWNDNLGINLLMINSIKGRKLFDGISPMINAIKSNIVECMQPQLRHPSATPHEREQFVNDFQARDFGYLMKKYATETFGSKIKRNIRKVIKYLLP